MLVFYAVMLATLMGFVGLAVDVGRMELRTEQLQTAADAGALSGAAEWGHGASVAAWKAAAQSDAQADEALNNYSTTGVTITSQQTASSGTYATDYAAVQTTITQSVPTFFLKLLPGGATAATITVRAVADAPPCMYFLGNPASGNGYFQLASASMYMFCPVYVRGTPIIDGFSSMQNHQIKSSANLSGAAPGGGWSTYPPFYNYPVLNDPLAYITLPTFSSCTYTNKVVNTAGSLNPGTYCGGLTINNVAVTFNSGLYIITGGISFNSATINGTGVTIYLTQGGGSSFGTMSSQNTQWNLTAPTSSAGGGITGIALCNDRSWVGGWEDFSFNHGGWYGDGIIYSTGTGIYDWQVSMTSPNYFGLVTNNLYEFGASIHPASNYASLAGGTPFHTATSLVQ